MTYRNVLLFIDDEHFHEVAATRLLLHLIARGVRENTNEVLIDERLLAKRISTSVARLQRARTELVTKQLIRVAMVSRSQHLYKMQAQWFPEIAALTKAVGA